MDGDGHATGEDAAGQHLVRRRHGKRLSGIQPERCPPPRGQDRRHLCNLAQHVPERSERVPDRDRQHGGAVCTIQQIGVDFRVRDGATPPRAAPCDQRGRQHLADEAVGDQMFQVLDLGSEPRLRPDHAQHPFRPGKRNHFLGLGEVSAKWPFAVNVLPRADRRLLDLQVSRHFHCNHDDVDLGRRDQLGDVGEGPWQPERRSSMFGAGPVRIGDTDDLKDLG